MRGAARRVPPTYTARRRPRRPPPMPPPRKINPNRRNAQLSTGPKTDEGKIESRKNALKHGMTGKGVVLPDEVAAEVQRRMEEWNSSIKPFDALEMHVFELLCLDSVRVDALNLDVDELKRRQVVKVATDWDERRRLAAEELAMGLPKAPALVVRQLR